MRIAASRVVATLLLAVAAALPAVPAAAHPSVSHAMQGKRYHSAVAAGDRLFNGGAYEKAAKVYDRLLNDDGADVHVLERAAATRFRLGDPSRAADHYLRTLEVLGPPPYKRLWWASDLFSGRRISGDEHYHRILARAASAWSYAGDHKRAVEAAQVVRDRLGDDIEGRHVLAQAYMRAGHADEAEVLYEEILELDPGNGTALNNLSTVRYLQRDLDGALDLLDAVLSTARTPRLEAIALHNVAEIHMLFGDYRNAEAHWRSAIEIAESDLDGRAAFAHFGLAALHNIRGRHAAALDEAITGWDQDRSGEDRKNEFFIDEEWRWQRDALVAEAEGRYEDAEDLWRMVAHGAVKPLVLPARHHARRIAALLADDL